MERVAFLIEPGDHRISCLVNPETVVIRRKAGIRPRESIGGALTGAGLSDAPLLFTGGGHTWIELELLFDVNLPGSTLRSQDVRDLSGHFFRMAENSLESEGYAKPPTVRMVWGKSWNIPGVITDVAERLDCFSGSGVPSRSWLKLRMRRVTENAGIPEPPYDWLESADASSRAIDALEQAGNDIAVEQQETILPGERLETLAHRFFGNASLWRFIAAFNGITDPFSISLSVTLRIPSITEIAGLP
jgi:hypothetical protein